MLEKRHRRPFQTDLEAPHPGNPPVEDIQGSGCLPQHREAVHEPDCVHVAKNKGPAGHGQPLRSKGAADLQESVGTRG